MELDTFENPVETTDELDTFEAGVYPSDSETFDEEVAAKGEEADSEEKQEVSKDEVETDSQVNNLDEKEDKGEEEQESKSSDEESSDKGTEEDKPSEEKSEDESKDADNVSKDDGDTATKLVKGIAGDKRVEIPEDTTFRVRINGKANRVPIQELINNYSGKVAYNEKFEELAQERQEFDTSFKEFEEERESIIEDIRGVTDRVKGFFEGKNKPNDALNFMLDSLGIDSFQYNKAVFEQMAEEFINYAQMDEVERDNYWLKQEKEHLLKSNETLAKKTEAEKTREESQRHLEELRQTHGISEEQYSEAVQDIEELGEEADPETVVRYAAMKPFTLQAEDLVEPYKEQMDDQELHDVVVKISRDLFSGELDKDTIAQILEENYKLDEYISEANSKVVKDDAPVVSKKSKEAELESFDDFDNDFYGY